MNSGALLPETKAKFQAWDAEDREKARPDEEALEKDRDEAKLRPVDGEHTLAVNIDAEGP